jgi:hypothetical protein
MLMKELSAAAGDNVGGVTITGTLRCTGAMKITGTLRAVRFFRFVLFFLADTSICMADSTSTADIAMINIRTGLTIFDSPFATAVFQTRFFSCFEMRCP